jgi:hypothetical protein
MYDGWQRILPLNGECLIIERGHMTQIWREQFVRQTAADRGCVELK